MDSERLFGHPILWSSYGQLRQEWWNAKAWISMQNERLNTIIDLHCGKGVSSAVWGSSCCLFWHLQETSATESTVMHTIRDGGSNSDRLLETVSRTRHDKDLVTAQSLRTAKDTCHCPVSVWCSVLRMSCLLRASFHTPYCRTAVRRMEILYSVMVWELGRPTSCVNGHSVKNAPVWLPECQLCVMVFVKVWVADRCRSGKYNNKLHFTAIIV